MRNRGSIFTGFLLIVLGALFLVDRFDPAFRLGHWIRIYWPLLIILWGVAKLIDHLLTRREPGRRPPFLSGGEAALLILLAFVLSGFAFRDWIRDHYPDFEIEVPPFHQSYTLDRQLEPRPIAPGAHLVIETEHGDLSIHAGTDDLLRVRAKESAWAPTKSAADEQLQNVQITIDEKGSTYRIRPNPSTWPAHLGVDLDVTVPKDATVEADTQHGGIEISGISGGAVARSADGDIRIEGVGGDVALDLEKGDAKISAVSGNVKLTGRGNDIELANISGDVTAEGAFLGALDASNLPKTIRWLSPWADLTVQGLSGRLEADSGDVAISGAGGPMKLITHNKDIKVANVLGRIEIVNTHGDVEVSYASPPQEDLSVTNDSGDAEVTLPAASNFQISAISKSGEVQSEFGSEFLHTSNQNDRGEITGRIGTTGPRITIVTTYGTIDLNKT
jgi:Putative adhesin/Domain of unknown function (DUF5668)